MDKSRELCDNGSVLEKVSVNIYAHSRADAPIEEWQTLQAHCNAVAAMSVTFVAPFASGEHGRMLGRLHDLGKTGAGQSRIQEDRGYRDKARDRDCPHE